MTKSTQFTVWSEYPDANTDRGWLKALCAPYDRAMCRSYTERSMPVYDGEVPGNWREQSTLGNYLDYGPCRVGTYSAESIARNWPDGMVHCMCYASNTHKYVRTASEAREWIESECARMRPELVFQGTLAQVA